jgi:hypothetical protein
VARVVEDGGGEFDGGFGHGGSIRIVDQVGTGVKLEGGKEKRGI